MTIEVGMSLVDEKWGHERCDLRDIWKGRICGRWSIIGEWSPSFWIEHFGRGLTADSATNP